MAVNLDKQLEYMYGLERFGIKLGLEVMQTLMTELGHPHHQFSSVHITGTNGKGSTAAILESVLRVAGYKTALYTSPHLFSFNERIRINNISISDEDLGVLIDQVKKAAERGQIQPTFFEFTTAVAFLYFAQHQPDIAVIEVGIGGLLDATNIVTPKTSVITNIGLDHVPVIGRNKEEIAANKAGIIKTGVPVVTAEHSSDIRQVLAETAQHKKSALRYTADEIEIKPLETTWQAQKVRILTRRVRKGFLSRLRGLECTVPLLGTQQLDNIAVALLVLDELTEQGIDLSPEAIQQGLAITDWPGRMQVVSEKPFILVDGAHNAPSLEALHHFLIDPTTKPPSYDVLVVGVKNDKDISFIRDMLVPLFKHIIATQGSYEPMPAEELAKTLVRKNIEVVPNPQKATQRGLELIDKTGSLVITGSLYMIPEALMYLKEKLPAAAIPASL